MEGLHGLPQVDMLRAKDIMATGIITVRPEMLIRDLAQLLVEKDISGAPVVDAAGRLVGVVSKTDVLNASLKRTEPTGVAPSFFRLLDSYLEEGGEETPGSAAPGQVDDIMTRDVVTATEDTPVHELARSMAERRIRRLIVTRDQRPIGLITVMAVLRTYPGATPEPAATGAAPRPRKAAPARRRAAPKARKKAVARRR